MFLQKLFGTGKNAAGNTNLLELDRLNMIWFTAGGQSAPFIDADGNAWAVSDPAVFSKVKRDTLNTWQVLDGDIRIETIAGEQIRMFLDNLYYRYGCKNIVMDKASNVIGLEDKLSIPAAHYDKSVPGHEVSNPKVRNLILRFNQMIASKYGATEAAKEDLVNLYLDALRGSEVLLPAQKENEDGKMSFLMKTNFRGTDIYIAYTDFEAIPSSARNAGYTNGIVQTFDSIMDMAIKDNLPIALNLNSPGGGIFIPISDMMVIKNGGKVTSASTPQDEAKKYFAEAVKYQTGRGVAVNLTKAVEYYKKSAELGDKMAQNNLAVLLRSGYDGVAPDIKTAMEWFEKASDEVADAAFTLGRNYDLGNPVVRQDLAMAAKYYQKSADMGHPDGTFNLGVMYLNGEGVTRDQGKGIELIQRAARLGSPNAAQALKQIFGN